MSLHGAETQKNNNNLIILNAVWTHITRLTFLPEDRGKVSLQNEVTFVIFSFYIWYNLNNTM
jgi:hypothetical protein